MCGSSKQAQEQRKVLCMSNQTCDTKTDPRQSAERDKSHRKSHVNQYLITDFGSVMHSFIP